MEARARAELFAATAERRILAEAIIEKDFWVCWVLKQVFSIDSFEGRLLFKGGDIALEDFPRYKPVLRRHRPSRGLRCAGF